MVRDLLYDNLKLLLSKTSKGRFYQPRFAVESEIHDNKLQNVGLTLMVPSESSSVFSIYVVDALISI